MKNYFARACFIPLFSGLLLAPLGTVQADQHDAQGQGGMVQQQQPAMDISDQSLEQFADAYVDVGAIHTEYSQKLQQVEEPEQAQSIQQEANDKMVQAIEENGLEVQEYSQIAATLERDPDLREKAIAMIEERQ